MLRFEVRFVALSVLSECDVHVTKRIPHCESAHFPAGGETLEWCRLELSRCLLEGLNTASCKDRRVFRDALIT
jgi:hypothetical protein